jgi:hypothetical protein
MDFAKDITSVSGLELAVLAALLLVVAVVGWRLYSRFSGREHSDIEGLHFTHRPPAPPGSG